MPEISLKLANKWMNLPNIFLQIGKSLLAQVIQARYIKKKINPPN